jgi:hypothetical protein
MRTHTSGTAAAALVMGAGLLVAAAAAQGTGRWSTAASMPSARTEVAVAEVAGTIYVIGGFGGERELEIYHPDTDRWSRGTPIPRALHHAAAVGLQGKLYVVGGYVDGWTPTNEVHEYDPARQPLAVARRLAHATRRARRCGACGQDPRGRWCRLAKPQLSGARGLRSGHRSVGHARECTDTA